MKHFIKFNQNKTVFKTGAVDYIYNLRNELRRKGVEAITAFAPRKFNFGYSIFLDFGSGEKEKFLEVYETEKRATLEVFKELDDKDLQKFCIDFIKDSYARENESL